MKNHFSLFSAFCCLLLLGCGSLVQGQQITSFSNPAPIAPADRASNTAGTDPGIPPAGVYPSTINVSGLTGPISKVTVTFAVTGTFPDDLDVLLVGPTGAMSLVMSDAGGSGDPANVTYTFDQTAAALMPDGPTSVVPAGTYQPSNYAGLAAPEPGGMDNFPTAGGLMSYPTSFAVFNGTNPNGAWKLYVVDDQSIDTNSLPSGWSVDITTASAPTSKAACDFNGDGKTDYAVLRNTGGGSGGQVTWFVQPTGGAAGSNFQTPWGIATDFFLCGDFDGDGKSDLTVWRGDPTAANFFILQSSTSTFVSKQFGKTGDDPTVVGDYDGDGKTDVAVYRAGVGANSPSTWYYRPSGTPAVNFVPFQWGVSGDFPAPGDYDGDGKNDFVVQRPGGAQGVFFEHFASGTENTVYFGVPTDLIVPGDYDGDGKTDIATVRSSGGSLQWNVLRSSNGTITSSNFGLSATDYTAQGDYDGDGKTDVAVWRPSADPTMNFYYILRSGDQALQTFEWGQNGDVPVANFNSH
jgi:subtilisin-like proprotein convertase family protein